MMETVVYVGNNVRELRTLSALTQAELASRAGITATALSRIERNEAEPRPSTLRKLATALGVEPSTLIKGSSDA
ncbi:MAG: helix-turn-helix domain-containing protein [Actinomycetota bacterium]|nr:helix-turn-helix domain-containing protein [Actinomycetota bacterium]